MGYWTHKNDLYIYGGYKKEKKKVKEIRPSLFPTFDQEFGNRSEDRPKKKKKKANCLFVCLPDHMAHLLPLFLMLENYLVCWDAVVL